MAQATIAAASALATGTLSSHLNRPNAASDSRLLSNLIKSERNYISNLQSSVSSAHSASSALTAWGTSEAPEVEDISSQIARLLSACAEIQDTYVTAVQGYRRALKDIADAEVSIRSIVRDRDILVSRLIKASNKIAKNPNKYTPERGAEKVANARKELQVCEDVLANEEAGLVDLKRRAIKQGLSMRMRALGDAGVAMAETAQEAILLLDAFDKNDTDQMTDNSTNNALANNQDQDSHQGHGNDGQVSSKNKMVTMNPKVETRTFQSSESSLQTLDHTESPTIPAPHQLSADVSAQRSFIPLASEGQTTTAPPLPAKEEKKGLASMAQRKWQGIRQREFGPPLSVSMPPVPTARRLQENKEDQADVHDSSSEEDNRKAVSKQYNLDTDSSDDDST